MIHVRLGEGILDDGRLELEFDLEPAPADLAALIAELDRRRPGTAAALDSSAVNAAVNGEVVLHGRDRTPLADGDEVEFLVMFAGG